MDLRGMTTPRGRRSAILAGLGALITFAREVHAGRARERFASVPAYYLSRGMRRHTTGPAGVARASGGGKRGMGNRSERFRWSSCYVMGRPRPL